MTSRRTDAPPQGDGSAPRIIYSAAAMIALLPFSTDVFLTVLVDVGRDLHVDVAGAQRTMLAFTLGFAIAHLFVGTAADRFGRRPTALAAIAVFIASSVLAAVSPDITILTLARFIQGLAAAAGPIVARTLVRDTIAPERAGAALSHIGALYGLAPLIAPMIGVAGAQLAGWRGAPAFLAIYATILFAGLLRFLPETQAPRSERGPNVSLFATLSKLLRNRAFLVGALAFASAYGGLFSWLTTSAFLLIGKLGMARFEASLIYTLGSGGFLLGGVLSMKLAQRLIPRVVLRIGAAGMLLGCLGPIVAYSAGATQWWIYLIAILPFYVAWGLVQPAATAIAMRPFPDIAGQASAWLGMAQQIGGIVFAFIAASLGGGPVTLAIMLVCAALFTVSVFLPPQTRT
ncbi:MAG: MFS transporter [Ancalomicrobiaceae bacterium]|nr:MFS transporter [Ancalomicrobiaceae bacterium]